MCDLKIEGDIYTVAAAFFRAAAGVERGYFSRKSTFL